MVSITITIVQTRDEDNSERIKSIVHRFNIVEEKMKNMTSVERKGESDYLLFYMKEKIKTPLALKSGRLKYRIKLV